MENWTLDDWLNDLDNCVKRGFYFETQNKIYFEISGHNAGLLRDQIKKAADEIERLRKYERVVRFIASDYIELSYEKVQWQRDDWRKRCNRVMAEESE